MQDKEMQEAFEHYYGLGVSRTPEQVAEDLGLDSGVVREWHEIHHWDEYVQERIQLLNRAFAEQFHTDTLQLRKKLVTLISNTLENFDSINMGVPFDITNVADLQKLAKAYETLVRANVLASQISGKDGAKEGEATWADLLKAVG